MTSVVERGPSMISAEGGSERREKVSTLGDYVQELGRQEEQFMDYGISPLNELSGDAEQQRLAYEWRMNAGSFMKAVLENYPAVSSGLPEREAAKHDESHIDDLQGYLKTNKDYFRAGSEVTEDQFKASLQKNEAGRTVFTSLYSDVKQWQQEGLIPDFFAVKLGRPDKASRDLRVVREQLDSL